MFLISFWEKVCCDVVLKVLLFFICINFVNVVLMLVLFLLLIGLVRVGNDVGKGDWFLNCISLV